jgi:hypothetical protein
VPGRPRLRAWLPAVAALAFLAASCAAPQKAPETPAARLWNNYLKNQALLRETFSAITADASLNLSTPERKSRLVLKFWGNLEYPLRLDLKTGFGAAVAFCREDAFGWLAVDPNADLAYAAEDGRTGALALGLAMPFDLRELAAMAAGNYALLTPEAFDRAEPGDQGGWTYHFAPASRISSMALDAQGRPRRMSGEYQGREWSLELKDHGDLYGGGSGARKLSYSSGPEIKAIIRIKELERTPVAWPEESLALPLPPGTPVKFLEANTNRITGYAHGRE